MFPSILTLNVDLIWELFRAFLDQTGLFWGPGFGSKIVLGSNHLYYQVSYLLDSQNLCIQTFLKFLRTDGRTNRSTDRPTKPTLEATSRRLKMIKLTGFWVLFVQKSGGFYI